MGEVAQLQLIALSIVGIGILILLFIKAVFLRVTGFVAIVLGLFSLMSLAVPQLASPSGRGKDRHCQYQDPDGHRSHRTNCLFQQGAMRIVSFHWSK